MKLAPPTSVTICQIRTRKNGRSGYTEWFYNLKHNTPNLHTQHRWHDSFCFMLKSFLCCSLLQANLIHAAITAYRYTILQAPETYCMVCDCVRMYYEFCRSLQKGKSLTLYATTVTAAQPQDSIWMTYCEDPYLQLLCGRRNLNRKTDTCWNSFHYTHLLQILEPCLSLYLLTYGILHTHGL